jgi:hypothetical protein
MFFVKLFPTKTEEGTKALRMELVRLIDSSIFFFQSSSSVKKIIKIKRRNPKIRMNDMEITKRRRGATCRIRGTIY